MSEKHAPIETYETMKYAAEREDWSMVGMCALMMLPTIIVVWPLQLLGWVIGKAIAR